MQELEGIEYVTATTHTVPTDRERVLSYREAQRVCERQNKNECHTHRVLCGDYK